MTAVDTTILELAAAVYDEAVALVGPGEEADALALAAFAALLSRSRLDTPRPVPARDMARGRRLREAPLRASA